MTEPKLPPGRQAVLTLDQVRHLEQFAPAVLAARAVNARVLELAAEWNVKPEVLRTLLNGRGPKRYRQFKPLPG